jgi:hypothetical protein
MPGLVTIWFENGGAVRRLLLKHFGAKPALAGVGERPFLDMSEETADAGALIRDPVYALLAHRLIPDSTVRRQNAPLPVSRRNARMMKHDDLPLIVDKGRPREQVLSFDIPVQAFTHEASTLGGASGSAVVDLDTGHVIALHFGGAYLRANYAVPAWELSRDARVVDAGVNFVAPSADAETTRKWWASVESGEERPSETTDRGAKTMDQKNADGVITITIPLEITVRLGAAGAEAVARGAGRTESVAAAAPAEDDPAAPGEGEVSEIVDMETARAFANRGVGVFEEAVTAPSVTLEGVVRLLSLDMRAAKDLLDACTHATPRVTYGLGAKAKHGAKPGKDFQKIDCSGFVRELIWRSTSPSFNFPDGSVVQHQWLRDNGFAHSTPADARSADDIVRIAFLRPQDTSSGIGHVVIIYRGMTLKSHGGVGPDSRPWTATGWQASTYVYVLSES